MCASLDLSKYFIHRTSRIFLRALTPMPLSMSVLVLPGNMDFNARFCAFYLYYILFAKLLVIHAMVQFSEFMPKTKQLKDGWPM